MQTEIRNPIRSLKNGLTGFMYLNIHIQIGKVLASNLVALLILGCGGCLLDKPISMETRVSQEIAAPQDTSHLVRMQVGRAKTQCAANIALIDIDGLIVNRNQTGIMSLGTNPVADFRAKLDYVRRQPSLRAVVVRVNSPGGGAAACDMIWKELERFKVETCKPVVVCLMDVGAGGAYYIATAGDLILAHPTTVTGGVGVIFNAYDLSGFGSEKEIFADPVRAGELIDIGAPYAGLRGDTDEREVVQKIADQFHQRFLDRIEQGRGLEISGEEAFLDGRIVTASQAVDLGLVDVIGYLDDAIRLAATQVGCSDAVPMLIHRCIDRGDTPYAITPNNAVQDDLLPIDIPGLNREDLPNFLYMWQPNPSYAK